MSLTHVHLFLNHVPILGTVFAAVLFAIALAYRSAAFQRVALVLVVVFALSAIPVYLTGETAEEAVEHTAGVSKSVIERHEQAATVAFIVAEVLGGVALLGAFAFRRAAALPRPFSAGMLALALVTSGLFTWAGYLGGQIRHPEIGGAITAGGGGPGVERAVGKRHHDDD